MRLAAVAAVVSLSSQDALFADVAGGLLSDLVGDQLLEVRLAALEALVVQATAFQQRRQLQQEQEPAVQGTDAGADADADAGVIAEATDADMADAGGDSQQGSEGAASTPAEPAHGQQQQPQQVCRRKPRKSDLPPWGKDALLAAAAALSDRAPRVRHLALQLLQLLPPGNVPDLITVVRGTAVCVVRNPGGQDEAQAWAVVAWLGSTRAEMLTLAAGKLVPLLATILQPAAAGGQDAPAATHGAGVQAAAAAGVLGSAAARDISHLPRGAQILAVLMLLGVQQRKAGLPALLKEVQKAQLLEVPALQPWLGHLRALEQQQEQQQQQQQQQEGAQDGLQP